MTTPTTPEQIMKLADNYADASFEQGLQQKTDDPAPEKARANLAAQVEALTAGRDADKKQIRELDVELGDAKIAIQAAQSCTTHYCDLLKTCEAERDSLKADAARYRWAIESMKQEAETGGIGDEQMLRDACEEISRQGLAALERSAP